LTSNVQTQIDTKAASSSLSNYVTNSSLTTSLASYATTTNLTNNVNNILNGASTFTAINNTGSSQLNRIIETITSLTGSSSITASYSNSGIFYISSPVSANFTINLTNIPTTSNYCTYSITLLINSATNKTYCNAITVNGTSYTIIYSGGSANISVSSATLINQQIILVYTASTTVPTFILSSVSQIY